MKWALNSLDSKIIATPREKARCPLCKEDVIPKCGKINIWHWSHKSKNECDTWWEQETEWHRNWKNNFPKEQQEFMVGRHRADIRTKDRWIIELQNSSISQEEIKERENYYKRMIWVLNGETLCKGLDLRIKNNIITFRWKNPPKSWWSAEKEIYIDLSGLVDKFKIRRRKVYMENYEIEDLSKKIELFEGQLLLIKKIHHKIPCGGWGILLSKEEFLNYFKEGEDDTTDTTQR